MKSDQAKAAAQIKKYLKSMGLRCSVTSKSASMMNAVNVRIYDQSPGVVKQVEEFTNRYQYGHFDGMTDMYEYSNKQEDIPQVKYVSVNNEISPGMNQKVWEFMRPLYAGSGQLPEKYSDIGSIDQICGDWAHSAIHRFINGSFDRDNSEKFWGSLVEVVEQSPESVSVDGIVIEEHTHTKKGFQMFICILPDRVEREEYLALLDLAKSIGGWYSRKWGTTPAGFAFKDREKAVEFCGGGETVSVGKGEQKPKPVKKVDHSVKLRTLADKMQNQIDNKLADRLTNTPKRLAQASSARLDGERLKRTQTVLNRLADLHESGTVPEILTKFTSKKSVYDLMGTKKTPIQNGYHQYYACTGEAYHDTAEAKALWSLVEGKTEEEKQQEELKRDIEGLQFSKIPGYFPTPDNVIDKMLDYVGIEEGQKVLEPSAGSGAIADKVLKVSEVDLHCCESNCTLKGILQKKGFNLVADDFLSYVGGGYDAIIMNPPFEKWADIKHIKHALSMLKSGGKLVAICADGPRQRDALMSIADHWESLPSGAFKGSGTMVNTAIMVVYN